MDDLISRQALIEHLRRTIEASSNDGDYNEGFNDGMDFAASFASSLPSAQLHWIPCSERLPDKADGQYWVCTDTGYQCQCRWTDNIYGLGSNGEWAWKIFDIPQYSHVTAWMPLPNPYKGDEQDG